MAKIHVQKSNLSHDEYYSRVNSVKHLAHASPDINQWEFKRTPKPDWAPRTTDHVFTARCKKTGITQNWLMGASDCDEHGDFTAEHNRIREAFTAVLLELNHLVKKARSRMAIGQSGMVLADTEPNFDLLARDALHRGDHDNTYI